MIYQSGQQPDADTIYDGYRQRFAAFGYDVLCMLLAHTALQVGSDVATEVFVGKLYLLCLFE